jgi:hypothetical protein
MRDIRTQQAGKVWSFIEESHGTLTLRLPDRVTTLPINRPPPYNFLMPCHREDNPHASLLWYRCFCSRPLTPYLRSVTTNAE